MILEDIITSLGEEALSRLEIDTFKITDKCPRACLHCSQSPCLGLTSVSLKKFQQSLETLEKFRRETGQDLLTSYLLTTTDSDPFLHPQLAEIVRILYEMTGKRFYLLTSGWYLRDCFQRNADWIAERPEVVERIALTVSNFPTNPSSLFENLEIQINAVKTFKKMPPEKFLLSPQYNAEVRWDQIHSEKQVTDLTDYILKRAYTSKEEFKGRIFPRPVIGLGKAETILKVKRKNTYRIEAEVPSPIISTRERERPYSGMVDMKGELLVLKAPRAILNRELKDYLPTAVLREGSLYSSCFSEKARDSLLIT